MTVTANSVVTPQTPDRGVVRFVGTTDTTLALKPLYTNPGTDPVDVVGIFATNGATAHLVTLVLTNGGTNYIQNAVTVGANAGQNGTVAPVNLMSSVNWPGLPVDGNGNPIFRVVNGDTLQAEYATAQGTADTLSLTAIAARY